MTAIAKIAAFGRKFRRRMRGYFRRLITIILPGLPLNAIIFALVEMGAPLWLAMVLAVGSVCAVTAAILSWQDNSDEM